MIVTLQVPVRARLTEDEQHQRLLVRQAEAIFWMFQNHKPLCSDEKVAFALLRIAAEVRDVHQQTASTHPTLERGP
jgi:hypothetical protein